MGGIKRYYIPTSRLCRITGENSCVSDNRRSFVRATMKTPFTSGVTPCFPRRNSSLLYEGATQHILPVRMLITVRHYRLFIISVFWQEFIALYYFMQSCLAARIDILNRVDTWGVRAGTLRVTRKICCVLHYRFGPYWSRIIINSQYSHF